MAWAWGISRTIDYFETIDTEIDGDKVGVAGHSRFGKATLVAAAYDQRIVAAYPSCGGALGTSWARRAYGETLEFVASATNEYHWVNGNIMNYMGPLVPGTFWPRKVELLDVDTHSMMSLIAPRAVYTNGGTDNANGNADAWQDPRGMFLAGRCRHPSGSSWAGPARSSRRARCSPPTRAPSIRRRGRPRDLSLIDESHGGTPPFNVAVHRRHRRLPAARAKATRTRPAGPSFALFASRFLKDKRPVVTPGHFTRARGGLRFPGTLAGTDDDDASIGNWLVTGGTGAYKFKVDRETGEVTIPDRRRSTPRRHELHPGGDRERRQAHEPRRRNRDQRARRRGPSGHGGDRQPGPQRQRLEHRRRDGVARVAGRRRGRREGDPHRSSAGAQSGAQTVPGPTPRSSSPPRA